MRNKIRFQSHGKFSKSGTFSFIGILLAFWLAADGVQAAPLLRCEVIYAGSTYLVETGPTADPYSVAAVDIGERFRFKAVMVGVDKPIDYIKLYAYFQTRRKDIPVHQATYLPPFAVSELPYQLTPHNYLYAGEVERELQFIARCKE